jgi:hypothetical protein
MDLNRRADQVLGTVEVSGVRNTSGEQHSGAGGKPRNRLARGRESI